MVLYLLDSNRTSIILLYLFMGTFGVVEAADAGGLDLSEVWAPPPNHGDSDPDSIQRRIYFTILRVRTSHRFCGYLSSSFYKVFFVSECYKLRKKYQIRDPLKCLSSNVQACSTSQLESRTNTMASYYLGVVCYLPRTVGVCHALAETSLLLLVRILHVRAAKWQEIFNL